MVKPTMMQTLLGRPSQTYSFPPEKVYFSTKQDMVRVATEAQAGASPQTIGGLPNTSHPKALSGAQYEVTIVTDEKIIAVTDNEDEDDSEDDVFYTPNTSPRTSMGSTHVIPLLPPSTSGVPSTKTSWTHANTSTTSVSSSSLDAHSLFSIVVSDSSLMTSPPHSDRSHSRAAEIQVPQEVPNAHAGKEWAKDVRWLVPTPSVKSTTTPRKRHRTTASMFAPQLSQFPPNAQYRKRPNTAMLKSFSKNTPSIMTSMTALLEEDELQDSTTVNLPRPSVIISQPKRPLAKSPANHPHAPPKSRLSHRRSRSPGRSVIPRRSSSLSFHNDPPSSRASSTHSRASSRRHTKYASSSVDPYDPTSTSIPSFTLGDLPSHGTPGFTSLVLPRTPVPLSQTSHRQKGVLGTVSSHVNDADGKVDLTRSGFAQTTMASVEVVRGLSGSSSFGSPSRKLMGLFRRGSVSSPRPPSGFNRGRSQSEDSGARKLQQPHSSIESPLGFTSYRPPPKHVPSGSVLVQIWAVGVDEIDRKLVLGSGTSSGAGKESGSRPNGLSERPKFATHPITPPRRTSSLRSTLGRLGGGQHTSAPSSPNSPNGSATLVGTPPAAAGYIPGRSFVGRILECGWEVSEEEGKRGDWVVGLLDVKKCGALTEFVVVDRHRIHRVPHPRMDSGGLSLFEAPLPTKTNADPGSALRNTDGWNSPLPKRNGHRPNHLPLSLEELSLLPLCGIPAYRAVRTFTFAFSSADSHSESGAERHWDLDADSRLTPKSAKARGKEKEKESTTMNRCADRGGRRRRALVLRGHDGAGAMAVQMLVKQGWRVCAHAPYACLAQEVVTLGDGSDAAGAGEKDRMRTVEDRIRSWGGEEVVFDDGEEGEDDEDMRGAVIRVIERLCEDGDVFDAVLDTVGGKEIWEASERLLKSPGRIVEKNGKSKKETGKRAAADIGVKQFTTLVGDSPGRAIPTAGDHFKAGLRSFNLGVGGSRRDGMDGKKVGYAWVNLGQDVDWEGEGIRETLEAVLRMAVKDGVRPWVGANHGGRRERLVPFERAPEAFVDRKGSGLVGGGTMVIKLVV